MRTEELLEFANFQKDLGLGAVIVVELFLRGAAEQLGFAVGQGASLRRKFFHLGQQGGNALRQNWSGGGGFGAGCWWWGGEHLEFTAAVHQPQHGLGLDPPARNNPGQGEQDQAFDGALERAGAKVRRVAFLDEEGEHRGVDVDGDFPATDAAAREDHLHLAPGYAFGNLQ